MHSQHVICRRYDHAGIHIAVDNSETDSTEGNVMLKLGIVIGLGAAAWYWRKELGSMLDTQFPGLREKTARTLQDAGQSAERLYEQTKSSVATP
jgi:hypothetical protein